MDILEGRQCTKDGRLLGDIHDCKNRAQT